MTGVLPSRLVKGPLRYCHIGKGNFAALQARKGLRCQGTDVSATPTHPSRLEIQKELDCSLQNDYFLVLSQEFPNLRLFR